MAATSLAGLSVIDRSPPEQTDFNASQDAPAPPDGPGRIGDKTAREPGWRADHIALVAAGLAGGLALFTWGVGWHGADLPAALHRIDLFRAAGFTPWDAQWFGGHYTLGYSVLFAPLASVLGIGALAAACAGISAWAFARLIRAHFGRPNWLGAMWFAVGMAAPVAIGQLAFLLGATIALVALLAFAGRRRVVAGILAVACPLASPVAAALLLLVLAAWALAGPADDLRGRSDPAPDLRGPPGPADDSHGSRRSAGIDRRAVITLAALTAAPIGVLELLFPQGGRMPFAATTLLGVLIVSGLGLWLLPRRERGLRIGAALYGLAGLALFVVPQPMGANLGRLGTAVGGPLAAAVLWPRRRLLLAAVAIPLLLWQWIPAVGSVIKDHPDPSKNQRFFQPLVSYLRTQGPEPARVEIPPTQDHWETLWAAADVPLARGWERQVDIAENGLFYPPDAPTAASYQAWLLDHGVTWVALPTLTLDYSGQAEAKLVRQGLPYLLPAWRDANWQVWRVMGSPGLVSGSGHLISFGPNSFDLQVDQPGHLTIKVRFTNFWTTTVGHACIAPAPNNWTDVLASGPGRVQVVSKLIGHANHEC